MKKVLIIAGLCLVYVVLSISSALQGGDFDVYLDAAIKLNNHQNIYSPPFIKGLQYYYSPLFALMLIPFSGNFFITELFWLLFSGFLFFRTGVLIFKYLDLSILSSKENYLLVIITSFFIIRFLLYNIAMIQISIFLLWAIFESIQLINTKKWLLGALLLAFAINVKLMPLVILPYLFYRQKFKALTATIIISGFLLLLPAVFLGYDFNTFLLAEWWQVINPMNSEHMIETRKDAQSLVGMIPVFLTETEGDLAFSRNIFSFSAEVAERITNIVRLLFIVFTIYFLKSPLTKNPDKLLEIRALSYICLLIPLIFPHQQKYAFIFLYPMIIYLTYYAITMWKYNRNWKLKTFIISLLLVSIILTPIIGSDVIGRFNYDFIHHFRLLGITAIILIVYAVIGSPDKLKKTIAAENTG